MKRSSGMIIALLILVFGVSYSPNKVSAQTNAGWVTLFDGSNLDNWDTIGDANWRVADGVVQADRGAGYLVSKKSYGDFEVRAEFWVDADANSGVFLRCSDPKKLTSNNAYEVNIFDTPPDPTYGTGAIVNVAKPSSYLKATGKWNTYEITVKGSHFTIVLNGTHLIDVDDTKYARGPIGLQHAAGVVKFRKVQIKPL